MKQNIVLKNLAFTIKISNITICDSVGLPFFSSPYKEIIIEVIETIVIR